MLVHTNGAGQAELFLASAQRTSSAFDRRQHYWRRSQTIIHVSLAFLLRVQYFFSFDLRSTTISHDSIRFKATWVHYNIIGDPTTAQSRLLLVCWAVYTLGQGSMAACRLTWCTAYCTQNYFSISMAWFWQLKRVRWCRLNVVRRRSDGACKRCLVKTLIWCWPQKNIISTCF